jgi:hypothetical protein
LPHIGPQKSKKQNNISVFFRRISVAARHALPLHHNAIVSTYTQAANPKIPPTKKNQKIQFLCAKSTFKISEY